MPYCKLCFHSRLILSIQLMGSSAAWPPSPSVPTLPVRGLCTGTPSLSWQRVPAGFPGWGKDTQLCPSPGLKPPHAALRGLQGPARAGDRSPAPLLPRESRAHTHQGGSGAAGSWGYPREKPSSLPRHRTETAGQHRALVPAENGEEAGPLRPHCNFCGAGCESQQRVPLPELCLWSRFLTGFSLELGTRTFSSYRSDCQTISFVPSLYGNLFPIFSHHKSVHIPDLPFLVLGFSLAYVSLNINGPKMISRKKCIVNYWAFWAMYQLLQTAEVSSSFTAPPSQLDYCLPIFPCFSIYSLL